jgi:endonuclease/exonuclease/phosphatase family metal-dependent hydrolase
MPDLDMIPHLGAYAEETPTQNGSLHVVSWNIRMGEAVEAAVLSLREAEHLRGADIVLLQEMDEHGVDVIARALSYNYAYFPSTIHPRTGRNFGNAVLSPWPLSDVVGVPLPREARSRGVDRLIVGATALVGNTPIQAISVHTETVKLPWRQRLRQFERLAEVAADWGKERVVIGGDFNTPSKRGVGALANLMARSDLERVSEGAGPTFRPAVLDWQLDHVFARGVCAVGRGVVKETRASDHFALWVRAALDATA